MPEPKFDLRIHPRRYCVDNHHPRIDHDGEPPRLHSSIRESFVDGIIS